LESLHYFLRNNNDFLLFCFIRYDSDVDSLNLFEIIMVILSKSLLIGGGYDKEIEQYFFVKRNSSVGLGSEDEKEPDSEDEKLIRIAQEEGVSSYYNNAFNLVKGSGAICLDLITLYLNQVLRTVVACDSSVFGSNSTELTKLIKRMNRKKLMLHSVFLFNSFSAKDCFSFLRNEGLLKVAEPLKGESNDDYENEIADFLFKAPGLDKKQLGEFLAKPANT
jgi:hypothetical protein